METVWLFSFALLGISTPFCLAGLPVAFLAIWRLTRQFTEHVFAEMLADVSQSIPKFSIAINGRLLEQSTQGAGSEESWEVISPPEQRAACALLVGWTPTCRTRSNATLPHCRQIVETDAVSQVGTLCCWEVQATGHLR